jgi:hypothetical protein
VVRGAFTGTHAGFSGLGSYRFVGENPNPDLTATANVTGDGPAGGLNLTAIDPTRLQGLQPELAKGDKVATGGPAAHASAMHFAVFGPFRH